MTSCSSFGHEKNYQVEHYFPANFLCRLIKTLTLYSPLPSLPTFSLMFITRLNFKCQQEPIKWVPDAGRQLVIFKCPTQPLENLKYDISF